METKVCYDTINSSVFTNQKNIKIQITNFFVSTLQLNKEQLGNKASMLTPTQLNTQLNLQLFNYYTPLGCAPEP